MTSEEVLKKYILSEYKSIRAFSLAAQIPYSTITNVLKRGLAKASVSVVIDICIFLEIDVKALFYNQEIIKYSFLSESNNFKVTERISGISKETGEYIEQLPPEAIDDLNRFVKLLALAYLKDKGE